MRMLRRQGFWQQAAVCLLAILIMWTVTRAWKPPFPYRLGDTPPRDLYSRVEFQYPDLAATEDARLRALSRVLCYYENDPAPLEELREALADRLFRLMGAESIEDVDKEILAEFLPAAGNDEEPVDDAALQEEFESFRDALRSDMDGAKIRRSVELATLDFSKTGLLQNLEHDLGEGSTQQILTYPVGNLLTAHPVDVTQVRIAEVTEEFESLLQEELNREFTDAAVANLISRHIFRWLRPRLPTTLTFNREATRAQRDKATADVALVMRVYPPGAPLERRGIEDFTTRGIEGGRPLDASDLELLRAEHNAYVSQRTWMQRVGHGWAALGMYVSVFFLSAFYFYYRDRRLLKDIRQLTAVVALATFTICLVYLLAIRIGWWRGDLIPLMLFSMTISIAYRQEMAFLLASLVSFVATMSIGQGMSEFVTMISTTAVAALMCGTIRSRTRLVYVGLAAAAVGLPTAIGVRLLQGHPFDSHLLVNASWVGLCAIVAGLLMTALLPFLERFLGLQTDIRLLEIGDAAHPLLQELVRRAPGTYNHSINVASFSEAAAESIGANGLLCRVGAYFHDIGKMLKPEYFVENQGKQANKATNRSCRR